LHFNAFNTSVPSLQVLGNRLHVLSCTVNTKNSFVLVRLHRRQGTSMHSRQQLLLSLSRMLPRALKLSKTLSRAWQSLGRMLQRAMRP